MESLSGAAVITTVGLVAGLRRPFSGLLFSIIESPENQTCFLEKIEIVRNDTNFQLGGSKVRVEPEVSGEGLGGADACRTVADPGNAGLFFLLIIFDVDFINFELPSKRNIWRVNALCSIEPAYTPVWANGSIKWPSGTASEASMEASSFLNNSLRGWHFFPGGAIRLLVVF